MINLSFFSRNEHMKRCVGFVLLTAQSVSPATAQNVTDILHAEKYHKVFEYDFNQHSKPEDFNGTKVWDQNLWDSANLSPDGLTINSDHISLLTPAGSKSSVPTSALTTWSKAGKMPLDKFHFGYFEARMRSRWTTIFNFNAFWLESTVRPGLGGYGKVTGDWCEIDIFEGGQKNVFNATVHDWHNGDSTENKNQHTRIPSTVDYNQWNDYGALWDENTIRFYFNGVEVSRTPTPDVCKKQDVFIIIGAQSRSPNGERIQLDVQRIRVWQK